MQYKPTEKQLKRLLAIIKDITEYGKENIVLDDDLDEVQYAITDAEKLESFLFDEALSSLEENENVTFTFDQDLDGLHKNALKKKLIKRI